MNNTFQTDGAADAPWPAGDHRAPVPDMSMLPGSEKPAPAVVGLLNDAVQGAHDGIDRFAERAAPTVRQLGERVAAAGDAMQANADRLRDTRDAWAEGVRTTVRDSPLTAIAAAALLGAVIARLTR